MREQGSIYKKNKGDEEYILAYVGDLKYTLISLSNGNRYYTPMRADLLRPNLFKDFTLIKNAGGDETVATLRRAGYKVRVIHNRIKVRKFMSSAACDNGVLIESYIIHKAEKGGSTRVEVRTPSGEELVGEAFCNPKDFYNKKEGVKIALKRALESQ